MEAVVLAQQAVVLARRGQLASAEADAVAALELAADLRSPPAFLLLAGGVLLLVAAERREPPHPLAARLRDDGDSLFVRHLNHGQATLDLAMGARGSASSASSPSGRATRRSSGTARSSTTGAARPRSGSPSWAIASAPPRSPPRSSSSPGPPAPRARSASPCVPRRCWPSEEPIGQLQEAVATLAGSGAELEHARALVDLGIARRHARRPVNARLPLRAGHELASRCGATVLADRAHQELLASGARPRRSSSSGPDALTPSERRVVELAASGRSNRAIAEALFVTEKTVEAHLGRAYPKLAVRSRHELQDALAGVAAG
jgi:DNA-binding CsgD family transcriptional regulator